MSRVNRVKATSLGIRLDETMIRTAIARSNATGRPLFLIVLATKPCYIKLASLIFACRENALSFIVVESGQHYEAILTGASRELGYEDLIAVSLDIRGSLLEQAAQLARKIGALGEWLRQWGARRPVVPVVSGDTATAAFFSQFWYLGQGTRAVHVEAGLRSVRPVIPGDWERIADITRQAERPWQPERDEPFPEGIDTVLASVASHLLLAPVARNVDNLVREGYPLEQIRRVGSLSSDAVRQALAKRETASIFKKYPRLGSGCWLRVDLHRRENMIPSRLKAVLGALARLCADGLLVVLIRTNALQSAIRQYRLLPLLEEAQRCGLWVQDLWPSYIDVVTFLSSPYCLAVYTDSGGLQEETHILGVPCLTCRFSTDRPETILDARTNLLLPPYSIEFIYKGVLSILASDKDEIWPDLDGEHLYGNEVGHCIATILAEYEPPEPLPGARLAY